MLYECNQPCTKIGSEYLEFGIAMVLMVAIPLSSYLHVITPQRRPRRQRGNE
jgi:hypothetical protein